MAKKKKSKNKSSKKSLSFALGGSVINMESPSELANRFKLQGEQAFASSESDPLNLGLKALSGLMFNMGTGMFKKEIGALGGTMGVNAELEGQELGELPTGETFAVEGPGHEDGGVDIKLPEGTEIFSERIKIDGESMAKRKGKREKKSKTFEELMGKYKNDKAIYNAAMRTQSVNEKENKFDVEIQNTIRQLEEGVKENKFPTGGTVGEPPFQMYSGLDWGNVEPYLTRFLDFNNLPATTPASEIQSILGMSGDAVDNKFGTDTFGRLSNYAYPSDLNSALISSTTPTPGVQAPNLLESRFVAPGTGGEERSNSQIPSLDGVGDMALGTVGTLISSFAPLINTNRNRRGDTPNINPFQNFGQEALRTLDESRQYNEQVRDSQLSDLELSRNSQLSRARGGARSVNTLRGLDTMVNLNADSMQGDIYDKFSAAMSEILGQKSHTQMNIDERVMTGEKDRDIADRMDRDAYYTNRGEALAGAGMGLQQLAKMFNQNRDNNNRLDWVKEMEETGITYGGLEQLARMMLAYTNNLPPQTETQKK